MNWPEALVSTAALLCGTLIVVLLVWLRREQLGQIRQRETQMRVVPPPSEAPEPDLAPPAWIAPPHVEEQVTEAYTPTEAYDQPVTEVDYLAERLERLERRLTEGS